MPAPLVRSLVRSLVLALALVAGAVHAQDARALAAQARAAYAAGQFAEAGPLFLAAAALDDGDPDPLYDAARAFALAGGHADDAFAALDAALASGWIFADHLREAAEFESLHADPRWAPFVARVAERARLERQRWGGAAFETAYRDTLSAEEKAAGLSRLWAEVRFNFANFDLVPRLDWDSLYVATLPAALAAPTTADYYRVLQATVAQLRDGHSNVYLPGPLAGQTYNWPALRTALVGGVVAVTEVYDDALRAEGVVPGAEVVAVDGVPVRTYAETRIRPYESASTAQDLDVRTYDFMLLAGPPGTVALTLRHADGRETVHAVRRLTREERAAAGFEPLAAPPPFRLTWLPGRVALVELGTFGTDAAAEQFAAAFDEIATASALVLDLRRNGGGNSSVGGAVLALLSDRPIPYADWHTLDYRPAHRAWGLGTRTVGERGGTFPADGTRHFAGPVAALVGPRTFSAAEDFLVAFDAMDRGPIVGEPTGGSTGQPLWFGLPGGGRARVTAKRDTYPDGREFVGSGIQPDVAVAPTLDDLRAGRDPVLAAALDALGVAE